MDRSWIEQVNAAGIVAHIRAHYGMYGLAATIIVALLVGVYLGYTPEQVWAWLGLGG